MSATTNKNNVQRMFAMGTAVVGSVALMAKLGVDEIQNHTMKRKINSDNVYSSVRLFPDLVRFQGFIRIHRVNGDIVCTVPQKQPVQTSPTPPENDTKNENEIKNENENKPDSSLSASSSLQDSTDSTDDGKAPAAQSGAWLSSISRFASKLQTMYEAKNVEFLSAFPFAMRDCVLAKPELRDYLLANQRYLKLFEPECTNANANANANESDSDPKPASSSSSSTKERLNRRWEFCAVKVHHETFYIRYEHKWLTLSLNSIDIAPLSLSSNADDDVMPFVVDYQKYFVIDDKQGYVLLCQHLDDDDDDDAGDNDGDGASVLSAAAAEGDRKEADGTSSTSIAIPDEHSKCPYPFIQRYLVGHSIGYHSRRKEKVLEYYAKEAAIAMKKVSFDNVDCYAHAMQFRACVDATLALTHAQQITGVDRNVDSKQVSTDNDDDDAGDEGVQEEHTDKQDTEEKTSDVSVALPYFELLHQRDRRTRALLHTHELSETEWRLSSEAAWLSNYVYDIDVPTPPQQARVRRDSWSQFKAYWSEASSGNVMNALDAANTAMTTDADNHDDNDNDDDDDNDDDKDDPYTFCGPSEFANNDLWRAHSRQHCGQLHEHGFQLLDYAVTMPGTSVQWMLCRSQDHANTIVLSFKGTSNPLDGMVNIGLHPLYLPQFQCSVFSGMFAALQQSLSTICQRLKFYSCDDCFQTKIHRLVITGHSLGGGYAQLFLAHLLSVPEFEDYFSELKCITFGSPLVFCKDVTQSFFYDKLKRSVLNFVYQFDLVPRLLNKMPFEYRNRLLQGLLLSQLPVSNIGIIFDINQRLNFVMQKFQQHQWLLDRYEAVGAFISLFEKDAPTAIDATKKGKCYTKGAHSYHLAVDAERVLTLPSLIPNDRKIYATQILNDHKMLNYMKTVMFQANII